MPDGTLSGYGRWSAGGSSLVIEYSCALLGNIRVLVVEGLHSLSHGGIEVGGILYGTRSGQALKIEVQRPIECEHARGPSFKLSENDLAGLERVLGPARNAPAGMEVLGWYHSHTRSGICLTQEDLTIHDRFFPQPWQVALVLHPEIFGPVTAGFFFREANGAIRAESSYQEFEVLPAKARAAAAAGAPSAPRSATPVNVAAPPRSATPVNDAAALAAAHPVPPAPHPTPPARPAVPQAPPTMPGKTPGRAPVRDQAPPLRIMAPDDENPALANPERLGAFLERLEPRRNRRTRWIVGALLCVAAFYLGLASRSLWQASNAPQALSLRAYDQGGQLRVEWDRASLPVGEASSGMLEIADGGEKVNIPLNREHLASGGISYARRTGDVDLRLKVTGSGGTAQEVTRFVGSPPQSRVDGAR
jgi:proteasome lid subunit RPN8/RPN11